MPPKLIEIPENQLFQPITAEDLRKKIIKNMVIEPKGKIEQLEKEVQDLRNVGAKRNLTLCPLCCRAFRSRESVWKHVILCHENYNTDGQEKQKYGTPLKSVIDVRVTSLSQLLVHQLSKNKIRETAEEIVNRQEIRKIEIDSEVKVNQVKKEPNFHVSKFCEDCIASGESETPAVLAEILFQNTTVDLFVKFVACGDGSELVDLAGLTKGYCYKCEIQIINPKLGRGRKFSRQVLPLNGEAEAATKPKPEPRTLKKANFNSKRFKESKTKNLTQKRKEFIQYERPPINQYQLSIEEAVDPEFHTALNIASQRVYSRGLEYCKLLDAHLLENMIVQENQQTSYKKYLQFLPAYKERENEFQASSIELKGKIEKLEQVLKKARERVKKIKVGARSEEANRARKLRDKKKKKLNTLKKQRLKEKSTFENSSETKKFNRARAALLEIPGPRETAFLKLGIKASKKKVAVWMEEKLISYLVLKH